MKQKLFVIACMLCGSILMAQSVPMALEDWKTTQGTQNFFYKNVTKTDPFGNVIIAGATMNNGTTDILVAKYNSSGTQLWIQQFAGTATNGVDFAAGLYVTDTHVYLTGAISNNNSVPETDCVTMKLASSSGAVVWSTTYSGSAGSHDSGKGVIVDGAGNVYVSGGSYNSSFNTDYLALKYNSAGVQQWANTWDYGGADDAGVGIGIGSGSNINIVGAVTTPTPGVYKLAAVRFANSTGALLATNVSTAVTTTSVDAVTDMVLDVSGDMLITGSQYTGSSHDFYVQKLDASTLVSQWIYTWNGSSSLDDHAKAIARDASGNVYVAGLSTSSTLGRELTVIKLNSSGVNQWTQTSGLSGDDEATDLVIDVNGDVYVTGYKTNRTKDYYTVKYDASGTKVWETETDGNGSMGDNATNMALDSLNNVVVTGQSETGSGDYEFMTVKYVQKDITTPTDFNGESPAQDFAYYRNAGQLIAASPTITTVPDVKFYTNSNPTFYFKNRSQSIVFARLDTVIANNDSLHRIDLEFNNSNESAETYPMETSETNYQNFFFGHTGSKGVTNIRENKKLITTNLYNNIDLMWSSNQNGIKYYFIVKPGGDMRDIQIEFTGASSFNLDGTTNELTINSSLGSITYDRPTVYQLTSGNVVVPVTGWTADWQTNGGSNKYKFNPGAYTSSLTLVIEIDQGNGSVTAQSSGCDWSTFYGGAGFENAKKVITDASGNSYFIGETDSPNYPNVTGGYITTLVGRDGFIVKLNPNGGSAWGTFFSGNGGTLMSGIGLNSFGEIYVCGTTSDALMPLVPAANTTFGGLQDAFLAKFNTAGTALLFSRFYGTTGLDNAVDLTIDASNNIYVVGDTDSNGIPLASGTFNQTTHAGGISDGFMAKFTSAHTLSWATYFGGDMKDFFESCKMTSSGNIIASGITASQAKASSNALNTICGVPTSGYFPDCTGGGSYYGQNFGGGFQDAFVCEFSPSGAMIWSSFYGGLGQENNARIVLSPTANTFYLIGNTTKDSYNMTTGPSGSYLQSQPTFGSRGYIAKFVNRQPTWFTLLGDGTNTFAYSGISDALGNVYIAGNAVTTNYSSTLCQPVGSGSTSTDFPKCFPSGIFNQPGYGGGSAGDAFLMGFNSSNQILWSTLYGSASLDDGRALAFDNASNKLVFAGNTQSGASGFPLYDPANGNYQQNVNKGGQNNRDCFFAKLCLTGIGTSVGVTENSHVEGYISAYPNPNSGSFSVDVTDIGSASCTYQLIDVIGKVIEEGRKEISEKSIKFNFTNKNCKSGMYFLKINTNDRQDLIKFIIE